MVSEQNCERGIPDDRAAQIDYLKDLTKYKREKPYILALDITVANEAQRTNLEFETHNMKIYDLRLDSEAPSFDSRGFELLQLRDEDMKCFFGSPDRQRELLGVTEILRRRFTTDHVFCYDHAVSPPV